MERHLYAGAVVVASAAASFLVVANAPRLQPPIPIVSPAPIAAPIAAPIVAPRPTPQANVTVVPETMPDHSAQSHLVLGWERRGTDRPVPYIGVEINFPQGPAPIADPPLPRPDPRRARPARRFVVRRVYYKAPQPSVPRVCVICIK